MPEPAKSVPAQPAEQAASGLELGKRTVRDLDVATGEAVLARVDFNVPLDNGRVADDARIRAALPTIELLLERDARLVLCSHLGRPKGRDPETSLRPVSEHLGELIEARVHQAPEVVGPEVRRGVERLEPGNVLVLENTRWERGETENDPELSKQLAALADAYVNDAFGAAHRAHASTVGVTQFLRPAVAGLLLEREVVTLRAIIEAPERPLVVVLGGAKVSDKIALIERFLDTADTLLIGGAMCFSFFRAQGISTGDSLVEEEGVELARKSLEKAESSRCRLMLPVDLVLGRSFDEDTERREQDGVEVPDGWMGLDIGPRTAAAYAEEIVTRRHRLLERPDGRLRARRRSLTAHARSPRPSPRRRAPPWSAAATPARRSLSSDSPTGSTTCRPAAVRSLELLEGKQLPGVEALDDA